MEFFNNAVAPTELRVGRRTVQIQRRLAEGGFGVVDLVVDAYSKQELVLKRCNIDRAESFEIARKEISMLQKYKGPYIVELLESAILEKSRTREALLLMEYYPGDHLLGRLLARNGSYLPQDTILRMFGQLCLALKDLHLSRPPIVHRDIKLENVLFGTDGKVRLCDFGSCVESPVYTRNAEERQDAEEHIQKETTQMYRAPEMVDLYLRPVLTEKTDIWAMGCMLYAMCFLIHPFQDGSSLGILNAKIHFPHDSLFGPDTIHALILRMLDVDPECRPSIEELIQWVSALSSGQPLPHQVLSSEAQQCRANRIAADQVRESKASSKLAKQKAAQAKPAPKKPVQPSANSVAARRLAAMRGQPLPEEQQHQQQYSEYSVQEGNAVGVDRFGSSADYCNDQHSQTQQHTFDPFADHPAVATATTAPYVSPSASTFAFSTAAAAAPPRASFAEDSQDSAAAFTPSSGAGAVEAFAAFNTSVPESSTFDPFAAPAVDVTANAAFKAFGATPTTSDGFSNFDSDETPSFYAFGAGVPSAASGFDAFQAPGLGADYDFAPTEVASVGGVKLSAGFDNFDAPVPTTTGFKTFSLSADNPFDSFEPTANSTNDAFTPSTFDPFAEDSHATPVTAGNDGFVGSSDFEVTPTPTPAALVVDFFATTDEPADVHAAAPASKATKRSSAASLLFQAFMDEPEPSAVPVPEPVPSTPFDDPPAFLAPSPAKAPTTPALIDIFNDDLVSAAPYNSSSTVAGAGSAPDPFGAASGKRNPLDVLSLYDMPAPTPAPKSGGNGMAGGGTGMSAAASISNIAVGHAGPMAMGGVHPASSAGAGFHCMSIGMSGKGVGAAAGPRGMPAGSMVGGMCTMQGVGTQQQGRGGPMTTPMNSPMGASFSPTGRMGGPGVGVGTSMGMGGAQSGHLALYQSSSIHSFGGGSSSSRAPTADPFDAINVLKK